MRTLRRPFARLLREGCCAVLERWLPAGAQQILELGAGDGQLAELLPEAVVERCMFSEPLDSAVLAFRERHPTRRVIQASAGALPLPDASLDAVLGLCVLDVVDDLEATVRELRRVLRPGGRVIHWLDMSTVLSGAFELIGRSDFVPLPNVVEGGPGQRWPEDLLLVPAYQLRQILEIASRHEHPFAGPLQRYLAVLSARPLPLERALREYTALAESREQRTLLKNLFRVVHALADDSTRQLLRQFRAQPAASVRFFESRLGALFSSRYGFEVELSDVHTSFELVPGANFAPLRYLALCIGRRHELQQPPATLLNPEAGAPGDSEALLELGVYVFVARRLS